jgi:hypothetical protein
LVLVVALLADASSTSGLLNRRCVEWLSVNDELEARQLFFKTKNARYVKSLQARLPYAAAMLLGISMH